MEHHLLQIEGHCLAAIAGNQDKPGIPIVFLHGFALSVNFWLPNLPEEIKQQRPWYCISLPGHAPSSILEPFSSLNSFDLAKILATAIEKLVGSQPVILVGYSSGGFASLAIAACFPNLVKSIFCISGFAVGKWYGPLGNLQNLANQGKQGIVSTQAILNSIKHNKTLYHWLFSLNARSSLNPTIFQQTVDAVYPDATNHDPHLLCQLMQDFYQMDISFLLQSVGVPTLLLAGKKDPVIAFSHTEYVANHLSNVQLIGVEGMGHLFFAEQPQLYQTLLTNWIKS